MSGTLIQACRQRLQRTPYPARHLVAAAFIAAVTFASLLPGRVIEQVPIHIVFFDKLVHFAMYGIMAALLFWSVREPRRRLERVAAIHLFCSLYGVFMECLQGFLTSLGRSFSLADMLFNAAGAAVTLAFCTWQSRLHPLVPSTATENSARR